MIANELIHHLIDEIALHNSEKAYKTLFMQMHESLVDFATSILKSAEDAEEVVSDFFIIIKTGNLTALSGRGNDVIDHIERS